MLDSIYSFISQHWELVLSVLLFLASFVVGLLRKKPVLNKTAVYLCDLLERVPVFISLVEKAGHGQEKKQVVLQLCKDYLKEEFGFTDFDVLEKYISDYIETVLTTPQKKEV